jgi:hypothetical protein
MESKLGRRLEGDDEKRDAIHVAIAPVVADERLWPGQDVGFIDNSLERVGVSDRPIGIVDPFLTSAVCPDDRFWLLLYPGSVTSMRHEWLHPSFHERKTREESEAWLRQFCRESDCPGYDDVIAAAVGRPIPEVDGYGAPYRLDEEYFYFNGRDAHAKIPPEFWDHVEIVTGEKCLVRPEYFTCSC